MKEYLKWVAEGNEPLPPEDLTPLEQAAQQANQLGQ
jgi:hypothetical protein